MKKTSQRKRFLGIRQGVCTCDSQSLALQERNSTNCFMQVTLAFDRTFESFSGGREGECFGWGGPNVTRMQTENNGKHKQNPEKFSFSVHGVGECEIPAGPMTVAQSPVLIVTNFWYVYTNIFCAVFRKLFSICKARLAFIEINVLNYIFWQRLLYSSHPSRKRMF